MPLNIAKTLKGPCVVSFKQADFFSQDDVTVDLSPSLFSVDSSAHGPIDQRIDDHLAQVQFSPMGVWNEAMRGIYNSIAAKPLNSFLADSWRVTDTDAATDTLEISSHGIVDGTPVRFFTRGGNLPSGVAEATLYYTHAVDTDNVTLHASQAEGISGANPVDITADDESGYLFLIEQQPLRIQSLGSGDFITLHNAVVSQLAPLQFGATQQLVGQKQFRAFPKFGVDRATADSVYTTGNAPVTATLNAATILTQPYALDWGAAPWDSFEAKNGVTMTFNMQTTEDRADSIGVGMLSLSGLSVQVQAQPIGNLTEDHVLAKMKLQGAGAARGVSLSGDDLNIVGTGVYARLYNAALVNAGLVWSSVNDRMPQMTWQGTKAAVSDPLFYVGEAAPA